MELQTVVLAAGAAKRFGSQKLLADCNGAPMVARTVETVLFATSGGVAVITGHMGAMVRRAVETFNVKNSESPPPGRPGFWQVPPAHLGDHSSLPVFLAAVLAGETQWELPETGLLVCLGDMPWVRTATMATLAEAGRKTGPMAVVIPCCRGIGGNPVWLGRDVAVKVSNRPDRPVRDTIAGSGFKPVMLEVLDTGVLEDIDMREHLDEKSGSWMNPTSLRIVVRGAGDLGSGIIYRLFNSGFSVAAVDLANPTAVRRKVAFCEAIREGEVTVEGIRAVRVSSIDEAGSFTGRFVPVALAKEGSISGWPVPDVLIDARMMKQPAAASMDEASLVIGIGPGFTAGIDCHRVIETMRGADLGRVLHSGSACPDTGIPGRIDGETISRLLRAPAEGLFRGVKAIGDIVAVGEVIACIDTEGPDSPVEIKTSISGKIRGLLGDGTRTKRGMKAGDVDPRGSQVGEERISDKALAVAGGVLEAILSWHCGPG